MASDSINVRVTGELRAHVQRQVGPGGDYESANEYVRELIRADKRRTADGLEWLKMHLAPLVETPEEEFVEIGADEVIARSKQRYRSRDAIDRYRCVMVL